MTLRMMARPGRIRGVGSVFGVLRNALSDEHANSVGKIRLLVGQPEGDGASLRPQDFMCPQSMNLVIESGPWLMPVQVLHVLTCGLHAMPCHALHILPWTFWLGTSDLVFSHFTNCV